MRKPFNTANQGTLHFISASLPLVILLTTGTLFFSCSGASPEILQVYWELQWHQDPSQAEPFEALSLYVQGQDEDGREDLDRLYLLHEESELFWEWGTDEWVSFEEDGVSWIGTGRVSMPAGAERRSLPRGTYRVQLRDRAGRSKERTFALRVPSYSADNIVFPQGRRNGDFLTLEGMNEGSEIWFYSDENQLISRKEALSGDYSLEELFQQPSRVGQAGYFYLYRGDPRRRLGILSGPWPLERD